MTRRNFRYDGNGKIDRTPTPQGLIKIKRVSLEAFLRLKELVNSIKMITPRGNRKKSVLKRKKLCIVKQDHINNYGPSNIIYVYDSLILRWRRVNEWHRYINDPIEKLSGHIIT